MRRKQVVYLLQRASDPSTRYVGVTSNLKRRIREHNAGKSPHTSKYRDWKPSVAVWFDDEARALEFERYLKSGSGSAFAIRHLW